MVQIGVDIMSKGDGFTQWLRNIIQNHLFDVAIRSIGPIKLLVWDLGVVWFLGSNMDFGLLHLGQVANNSFSSIKMADTGCCSEAR